MKIQARFANDVDIDITEKVGDLVRGRAAVTLAAMTDWADVDEFSVVFM